MRCFPLGEKAVVLELGTSLEESVWRLAQRVARAVRGCRIEGVEEAVPAYASVTVFFDRWRLRSGGAPEGGEAAWLGGRLLSIAEQVRDGRDVGDADGARPRCVEIPVYYGGGYGPDLEEVAALAGLTPEEVVRRHAAAEYTAALVGFTPGFAYLAGLPAELATPRRSTPRREVPAGSVGIAGGQTGIYPLASPGGWNLIGRTPLRLFRPEENPPVLIAPGDTVRFRPVSHEEFVEIAERPRILSMDEGLGVGAGSGFAGRGDAPGGRCWVRRGGASATVQDFGRYGWQSYGVPVGGALDRAAAYRANVLVGNPPEAAVLECLLDGPELQFSCSVLAALAGGAFAATLNGMPLPEGRVWVIPAGARLAVGAVRRGLRGWLAVSGGFRVPLVLGSRSTYLPARIGGHQGRALAEGDVLPLGVVDEAYARRIGKLLAEGAEVAPWGGDLVATRQEAGVVRVRFVRGPEWESFQEAARRALTAEAFRVTPQSDRMGLRLQGPRLERVLSGEMLSSAVTEGVLQVPPDGNPILLLADRQTVGGYPRIAVVLEEDLGLLAQVKPGEMVRFAEAG